MTAATVHDPVCHMDITIESAAGSSQHGGQTYHFCALCCKRDFDEDPEGVLKAEGEFDHSQTVEHGMTSVAERKRPWWQFWAR